MLLVPAVLLVTAAVFGLVPDALLAVQRVAARFVDHSAYPRWVLSSAHIAWAPVPVGHVDPVGALYSTLSVVGALAAAALGLFGRPLRGRLPRALRVRARLGLRALRHLHSGHIGDYIAWWSAGAAVFGGVCLVSLR